MNSLLNCNVFLTDILGFTRILKEILVVILCQLYSFIGRGPHNSSDENKAVAKDDAAEIEWINIEAVVDKNLGFVRILLDYKGWKKFGETFWSSKYGI